MARSAAADGMQQILDECGDALAQARVDRMKHGAVMLSAARHPDGADTLGPLPAGALEVLAHDARPQAGEHVVVAVSDSGLGRDAVTAQHAFEAFYTTKPAARDPGPAAPRSTGAQGAAR